MKAQFIDETDTQFTDLKNNKQLSLNQSMNRLIIELIVCQLISNQLIGLPRSVNLL